MQNFSTLTDAEIQAKIIEAKAILKALYAEAGQRAANEVFKLASAPLPAPTALTKFQVGRTYTCRSIGDHSLIFSWTVVSRTNKRLTLRNKQGNVSVRGVSTYDGAEVCYPSGKYSMCPIIRAGRFEKGGDEA